MPPEPGVRFFLLSWDEVPEAVVIAKNNVEAERLVYQHHNSMRGTVRHWSWVEIKGIGGETFRRLSRPEWDINQGKPPEKGLMSYVDSTWLHHLKEEMEHYSDMLEWSRKEMQNLTDVEKELAALKKENEELRARLHGTRPRWDEGRSQESMMLISAEESAPRAYDAYGAVTDHKNYQGLPMPKWEDLPPKIKEAWVAACKKVIADCSTQAQEFYQSMKDASKA